MKDISQNIRIITYGNLFADLKPTVSRGAIRHVSVSRKWSPFKDRGKDRGEYLLVASKELDDAFADDFREHATLATRLVVVRNEGLSADRLLSRIVDLQIRTPQRFYVMETKAGYGKTESMDPVYSLLKRLTSALGADDEQERILDAKVEDGVLHVVSPNLNRLDVAIAKIPELKNTSGAKVQAFEMDEDGSFIYWPDLDLHLGWEQLEQIVNPAAAFKERQKTREFNVRYGRAVRQLREKSRLKPTDIAGLSGKQLRRVESGACRLTSNAIEALATAHQLTPNKYLSELAAVLE